MLCCIIIFIEKIFLYRIISGDTSYSENKTINPIVELINYLYTGFHSQFLKMLWWLKQSVDQPSVCFWVNLVYRLPGWKHTSSQPSPGNFYKLWHSSRWVHQSPPKYWDVGCIIHVIEHVKFQLHRVCPAGIIWKNRFYKNNFINKQIRLFIHQMMCLWN